MIQTIRLNRSAWTFDDEKPIGPQGAFGAVFEGSAVPSEEDLPPDAAGEVVAVKRLLIDAEQAAHRELDIADKLGGKIFRHVIPIYDAGLDADSTRYFVVMAKAERSLHDELQGGSFDTVRAATVLHHIATGLSEVPLIVHRDLKPKNVLWYDGRWVVADFGIARFVADTTSDRTLRKFMSKPFAAPEQWDGRRATRATDVYALGCIAHRLLNGQPPFYPARDDELRTAHCEQAPPGLQTEDARLRSLVAMMLRKSPEARPPVARVLETLTAILNSPQTRQGNEPLSELARIGAGLSARQSEEDAARSALAYAIEQRARLAAEAFEILMGGIIEALLSAICAATPAARRLEHTPSKSAPSGGRPFW